MKIKIIKILKKSKKSTKNINRINIDDENYKDIIAEKNKKHSKINLIKIDELLSISNIICENEDLIDAELHSDDEVVFEKKVVSNKTIIKDYSSKINKSIPKLYLNQIEFNKLRVMDECDLYSLRKRKNKAGDIYEVLEVTKDEIQKYKEKKKLNKKKYKNERSNDKKKSKKKIKDKSKSRQKSPKSKKSKIFGKTVPIEQKYENPLVFFIQKKLELRNDFDQNNSEKFLSEKELAFQECRMSEDADQLNN